MSDKVQHPLITISESLLNPPEQPWKDFVSGFGVSTINAYDTGWETAVCRDGAKWHPVERYQAREEAETGHQRWLNSARAGLTKVTDLGLPGHVEPFEVDL